MITSRFPLGDVSFSAEYFSTLVGEATTGLKVARVIVSVDDVIA